MARELGAFYRCSRMARHRSSYPSCRLRHRLAVSAVFAMLAGLAGCASEPVERNLDHHASASEQSPLWQAASNGELEQVTALVQSGSALNTVTEAGTPLMAAVRAGEARIAWYLLSEGADPDLADASGETPLMVAAGEGNRRMVELLLSGGARVNAADRDGNTAIIRAAEQGNLSVVKTLLTAGANVNVSQGGDSLLMKIVDNGDLLTAEMLLAAGADVHYQAPDGDTALDRARAIGNEDLEMLLVQAGARR